MCVLCFFTQFASDRGHIVGMKINSAENCVYKIPRVPVQKGFQDVTVKKIKVPYFSGCILHDRHAGPASGWRMEGVGWGIFGVIFAAVSGGSFLVLSLSKR